MEYTNTKSDLRFRINLTDDGPTLRETAAAPEYHVWDLGPHRGYATQLQEVEEWAR